MIKKLRDSWQIYKSDKWAVFGLILLIIITIVSVVGPQIYHLNPFHVVGAPFTPPFHKGAEFFGTDSVGRSVLAGVIDGGQATLLVGLVAGIISMTFAICIGSLGGYFGGSVDAVCMRITELAMVIPVILFALVVLTLIQPSDIAVAFTIGILTWPATARVARAEFSKSRDLEYVRVARTQGANRRQIIIREILPNAVPPLIVMTTLVIAIAMLFQAGLSYLGVTNPNEMTWGLMIGQNSSSILTAWWPITFPGIAVALTVLGVNLVGVGLDKVFNPRENQAGSTIEMV